MGPPLLTTITGRGRSRTQAISHTLSASGVLMGDPLNSRETAAAAGDMYETSHLIARHVRWLGRLEWDFRHIHAIAIPFEFEPLIRSYLLSVLTSRFEHAG